VSENPLVPVVDKKASLFIAPVASLIEFQDRYNIFRNFVNSIMRPGLDYGVIPGTGTKPTLLKAGAEKLLTLFGLTIHLELDSIVEDWTGQDHGGEAFFYYRYNAIVSRGGEFLASAHGSSNSWEGKYRFRWVNEMEIPPYTDTSRLQYKDGSISEFTFAVDKAETTGKYGKPAEYWKKFRDAIENGTAIKIRRKTKDKELDAWQIGGKLYAVPNPNPADLVNTLMKMAQKRAMVAAVLIAANASEYFTQDLDDMSGVGTGEQSVEGQFKDVTGEPEFEGDKATQPGTTKKPEPAKQQAAKPPSGIKPKAEANNTLVVEYRKLAYQLKVSPKDADVILAASGGDFTAAMQMMRETSQSNVPVETGQTLFDPSMTDDIEAGIDPTDGMPFGDK
jgi:hypothetical protein